MSGLQMLTGGGGNSLLLRRRMMMGKSRGHNLPPEYQEVEYLQSHGSEYIKTGIVPNASLSFYCKFQCNNTEYLEPGYGNVFGSRQASGVQEYQLSMYNNSLISVGNRNTNMGFNTNSIHIIEYDGEHTATVDGTKKVLTKNNISSRWDIILFGINHNGEPLQLESVTIYSAIFEDRGNFVPCYRKSDNKPGMYDLVTNSFFTNAGGGEFTVGPNV